MSPSDTSASALAPARTRSVSNRFTVAFIGVVTLLLVAFAVVVIVVNVRKIDADLRDLLDDAARLAQVTLPIPLWNLDTETLASFAEALLLREPLAFVEILSESQTAAVRGRGAREVPAVLLVRRVVGLPRQDGGHRLPGQEDRLDPAGGFARRSLAGDRLERRGHPGPHRPDHRGHLVDVHRDHPAVHRPAPPGAAAVGRADRQRESRGVHRHEPAGRDRSPGARSRRHAGISPAPDRGAPAQRRASGGGEPHPRAARRGADERAPGEHPGADADSGRAAGAGRGGARGQLDPRPRDGPHRHRVPRHADHGDGRRRDLRIRRRDGHLPPACHAPDGPGVDRGAAGAPAAPRRGDGGARRRLAHARPDRRY